jgi:proteic killer suppression protein
VIRGFGDSDTRELFETGKNRRFRVIERVALRKLQQLRSARTLQQMANPPGNRLEQLRSDRAGQHCIRINDQWRPCFRWQDGDAYDVEIVDYH